MRGIRYWHLASSMTAICYPVVGFSKPSLNMNSLYSGIIPNYHATYWPHFDCSGLINPKTDNLIGSGVVVHIPSFFSELQALENKGLNTAGRIFISSRSHIVLNLHQLVDKWEEVALGNKSVGTTRKGIGPTYSSKASRNGLRIGELRLESWDLFEVRFRQLVSSYRQRFGDLLQEYDEDSELAQLKVTTFRKPIERYD